MSNALTKLETKINALSKRERILIAAATITVFGGLIYSQWLLPAQKNLSAAYSKLDETNAELSKTQTAIAQTFAALKQDPDELQRAQLAALTAEIEAIDLKLSSEINQLIPPEQMLIALRDLLKGHQRLKLKSAITLGAVPIRLNDTGQVSEQTSRPGSNELSDQTPAIYQHTIELVFNGDYLSAIAYLRQLEDMPWKFSWVELELDNAKYPVIEIRLRAATLSLGEGWIGV